MSSTFCRASNTLASAALLGSWRRCSENWSGIILIPILFSLFIDKYKRPHLSVRLESGVRDDCLTLLGLGVGPLADLLYMVILLSDAIGGHFHLTRHRKRRSGTPALPRRLTQCSFWVPRTPTRGDRSHGHHASGPVLFTGTPGGNKRKQGFLWHQGETGLRRCHPWTGRTSVRSTGWLK